MSRLEKLSPRWLGSIVVILAILAYLPALRGGFVWDDANNIVVGDRLRSWQALIDVFLHPAMWSAYLPVGAIGTYRPLALATMVLDYKIYGLAPWGYHLTNVLLHGACQGLVFAVFWRWLGRKNPAFAVALVCAVHPSAVEAIAWINGRSEPLALLFGLLALFLSAAPGPLRVGRLVGVSMCLVLSMLGKETGAVFVVLVVLSNVARVRGAPYHHTVKLVVAGLASVSVYGAMRLTALSSNVLPPAGAAWKIIALALPPVWFRCQQAVVLPLDRSFVMVGAWMRNNSFFEYALYVGAAVAMLALIGFAVWRGRRLLGLGFFWWLCALVPASALALLNWPGLYRWLYIPLPGLLLGVQQLTEVGKANGLNRVVPWLVATLAIVFFVQTQLSIPVWRSNESLFTQAIIENPNSAYGYVGLGMERYNEYRPAVAARLLERALSLEPSHGDARGYLGLALADSGECSAAWGVYTGGADRGRIAGPVFMHALGKCHERAGQTDRAADAFRTCDRQYEPCREALGALSARGLTPAGAQP